MNLEQKRALAFWAAVLHHNGKSWREISVLLSVSEANLIRWKKLLPKAVSEIAAEILL